jgi:hypothetical protein
LNKDIKNKKRVGPKKYLNVILLIAACTFGLFALVNAFNGKVLIAFSELLIACMYLVNLLAFSRHKNYQFAAAVSLISTFFGLLIVFFEGGISDSGILWLLIFPPVAFFLQGQKKGAWWNGALLSVLIAIFFLSWFDVLPIHYDLLFFRQFIFAFLVLSLISYAYQYSIEENEYRLTQNQKELIEANDALQIVRKKQKDASRFSLDNPAPVFRTTLSGDVTFANDAARSIILDCKDDGSCALDPDFFHIVTQKIKKNPKIRLERKTGSETYSYDVVRVRNTYLNFYGRNITKEKEAEEVKN